MFSTTTAREVARRAPAVGRLAALPILVVAFIALSQVAVTPLRTTAALYAGDHDGTVAVSTATAWGTLDILPSADTQVLEGDPGAAGGSETRLKVQSSKNGDAHALVRFDLSTVPVGSDIRGATLTMCLKSGPKTARVHELHVLLGGWDEATVTWNTAPTVAAASAYATVHKKARCVIWTVTGDVQAWVDGAANHGWLVMDSDEGSKQPRKAVYHSQEANRDPASLPSLSIDYVLVD